MRSLLAAFRLTVFLLTAMVTIVIQSTTLIFTKGPACLVYPRIYYAFLCRLFGLKVLTEGEIETGSSIVYAGNHLSYLDIVGLGSILTGSFVAKKDVESWPFFGLMAKMQRTAFISRNSNHAAKETDAIRERLCEGLPLIVFPEGTSSIGKEIYPFKTSFFQIFLNQNIRIQPFTLNILSVNGQAANSDEIRDQYAWHGDMTLLPHLWSFAKGKGAVVKVVFQKPISALCYNDRKELSAICHDAVVKGLDLSPSAA
ncbi:MAG: 1-acyl-sn-glycerol-3-phosphate acyltransferase [Micavibrio aeruginosavorus]|uniref:1-acyl-sn-glycerol-3-phosphate acyltransferase n=1 Tax=Micavibrio aeruginosavorus TaxID=349221 RepID=A0A2W5B5M2_9BACT|nr:MAG: 1-acyl-sn-glycerol-3-phosphate acyltransferase [Micavibrio aeruginosavorus]